MKYEITSFLKTTEEDNWEEGCLPGTGNMSEFKYPIKAETKEELTSKLKDFFGNGCGIDFNACDEVGRIDIQRTENDEGEEPSRKEWEQYKAGEINLWHCNYSAICESVSRAIVDFDKN